MAFTPVAALVAATFLPATSPLDQAAPFTDLTSSAAGARLYQAKCSSCHSIAVNKIGPAHAGLFGRKAGLAAGYNYSPALRASKIVWDEATLDQWLQNPQKMVKGSRMFLSVSNPSERAAIITFLRSEAGR